MADNTTKTVPNFIPKKEDTNKVRSHIERVRRYLNVLFFISSIVFVAAIVALVLSYLFIGYSTEELERKKELLRQQTDVSDTTEIADLNRLDTRLKVASNLLENHQIITPVLEEIEDYTLQVVELESLSLSDSQNGNLSASGTGLALNYDSLAIQSDSFSESEYILNPIFSSFQANDDGFVSFQYSFEIDRALTEFENLNQ